MNERKCYICDITTSEVIENSHTINKLFSAVIRDSYMEDLFIKGFNRIYLSDNTDDYANVCPDCWKLFWKFFDTIPYKTFIIYNIKKYILEELKRGNLNIIYII